ncbi:MAG: transcription elongation factor GreA [Mycoplasmatales bacterium]
MKEIFLTKEQLDKAKKELEYYIHTKRKEVVERIKEAKSFGDLSENSEYDSAREEQAFVEAKIKELEVMVESAKIIADEVDTDYVSLGNVVTYVDQDTKKEFTYKIVGVGANPLDKDEPSISASAPIAKNLLGKKVGQEIKVDVLSGRKTIKIKDIK